MGLKSIKLDWDDYTERCWWFCNSDMETTMPSVETMPISTRSCKLEFVSFWLAYGNANKHNVFFKSWIACKLTVMVLREGLPIGNWVHVCLPTLDWLSFVQCIAASFARLLCDFVSFRSNIYSIGPYLILQLQCNWPFSTFAIIQSSISDLMRRLRSGNPHVSISSSWVPLNSMTKT